MTRQSRNIAISIVLAAGIGFPLARCSPRPAGEPRAGTLVRGGELVASVRSDPRSFNWLATPSKDTTTNLTASLLTQAKLVRVNRATQDTEPWLAESWTRADDGLNYTLKLRPNITFSDGHPFTSADVLFSFDAVYDEKVGSALADSLKVAGRKLQLSAPDPSTVVITFPAPFGPAMRLLDNLPILPRHKLEPALKAGTFGKAWDLSTPPAEIVGLGPFVLTQYTPGQRVTFSRNTRYWRKDSYGVALPYLDRVRIEIIPDQDSEMLQLEADQIHMTTDAMRSTDYALLKRAADAGRVKLFDLGLAFDPESLWFNLKPGGLGNDPRAAWLQKEELRQAVSLAVDRKLFADTVFLGAGLPVYGFITPANKKWYWSGLPRTPHDPGRARALLAALGLTDRNGDGSLEDSGNRPVRFTILIQKGRTSQERGAAVIRDELKKIGLGVDVAALDASALIKQFLSGKDYDAVYFSVTTTDTDPALNPDFWFSSGTAHVWNMMQKSPATDWERRVDELMARQVASSDERERKQLFDEVQKIYAEHLPIINFVAPKIYVAASSRVMNLTPAVSRPQLLWSADTLALSSW